jgi:hypothetical protein
MKKSKQRPSSYADAVGGALRRSARVARRTARTHGTPNYLWRDGCGRETVNATKAETTPIVAGRGKATSGLPFGER